MIETRKMVPNEEGLARLQRCFDENGMSKELRELRWRYLENPTGELHVDFAIDVDSDITAGVYCVSPARMKLGNSEVLGAQSIDTLTDARYRGQGVFGRLARDVYRRCGEAGISLVYGFPNGSSAPGFFGRLGWTRLDPVPFLIRPIRLSYLASRAGLAAVAHTKALRWPLARGAPTSLPARMELRTPATFGDDVDQLWRQFSTDVGVGVVRDARYLTWRYLHHPVFRYGVRGLYEAGELRGLVIWRVAEKHGGHIGYVMELMVEPSREDVAALLLRTAIGEMAAAGAEVALAWQLEHSPLQAVYRRAGFLPLPVSWRPIELHFGARWLGEPMGYPLGNRASWYLSYTDSDTV